MKLKILCTLLGTCGLGLASPAAAIDPPDPFCGATPANLTAGVYTLRLSNGKSLDAEGGGRFVDGAPLQGWDFHGGPNQRWLITPVGAGRYLVRSAAVAKAVDAASACYRTPGCRVITWRTNRGATQLWKIEQARGMHRLRLANGGMQLGLSGHIGVNGARAQTSTAGCRANQLWRLARVGDYREVGRAEGIGRLMSISVRLNNYTPNRHQFDASGERAYFRPNDSNVAFQFGSRRYGPFPVYTPVLEVGPDRMYKTYVNDWRSNRTTVGGESGRLKITVGFEDEGVEIITNCYNNFNCFIGEPRFDFRNTSVNVFIRPRFDAAGRLTFDAETRFSTDIAESGPCVNNAWAFLCDLFAPNRVSLLRDNLVRTINANLTGGVARVGLEEVLRQLAGGSSFRNVTVGDDGELVFF